MSNENQPGDVPHTLDVSHLKTEEEKLAAIEAHRAKLREQKRVGVTQRIGEQYAYAPLPVPSAAGCIMVDGRPVAPEALPVKPVESAKGVVPVRG